MRYLRASFSFQLYGVSSVKLLTSLPLSLVTYDPELSHS